MTRMAAMAATVAAEGMIVTIIGTTSFFRKRQRDFLRRVDPLWLVNDLGKAAER